MWKREEKESKSESERDLKMLLRGFEGGKEGHQLRNAGNQWQLKNARKQILPENQQKECSPADTLILVQ